MSENPNARHECRLSANITLAMFHRLEHIAELRGIAKSELVREAIRFYLDEQEDLAGSRKHFSKAFQRRVDYLDWQLEVLVQMVAYLAAVLAKAYAKEGSHLNTPEHFMQYALEKTLVGNWQQPLHQAWLRRLSQNRKPPTE